MNMGNKAANEEQDNDPKCKDALGKEIVEATKEQIQKELDLFESRVKDVEKAKENYQKQWDIDKEIYEICLKDFGLINPQHKYQENPRYWELQKEKFKYQIRQDTFMAEQKLKSFDTQLKEIQDQVESAEAKLRDLEA